MWYKYQSIVPNIFYTCTSIFNFAVIYLRVLSKSLFEFDNFCAMVCSLNFLLTALG